MMVGLVLAVSNGRKILTKTSTLTSGGASATFTSRESEIHYWLVAHACLNRGGYSNKTSV
jgi:hypothetical protein